MAPISLQEDFEASKNSRKLCKNAILSGYISWAKHGESVDMVNMPT